MPIYDVPIYSEGPQASHRAAPVVPEKPSREHVPNSGFLSAGSPEAAPRRPLPKNSRNLFRFHKMNSLAKFFKRAGNESQGWRLLFQPSFPVPLPDSSVFVGCRSPSAAFF